MKTPKTLLTPEVLIIGGGPSGLRAAKDIVPFVAGDVLVVERESEAGGIPRHSDHPGYGIRDLGRFMNGPAYAKLLCHQARAAGAKILTDTTVTDWVGDREVLATSPQGRLRITARVVILATGARERPRFSRLIPGERAAGIYTTGHLQNVVNLKHGRVGTRAVIVGAELVSWSAALTLKEAGCKTVVLTTEYQKPDVYRLVSMIGKIFFRTKVLTGTRIIRIAGKPRVSHVILEDLTTGQRTTVECDTVILTGNWMPDNELARGAKILLDPSSKAPIVDESLRTSLPGVFAIGNLVHPVDTADVAAIDGAFVVAPVLRFLEAQQAETAGYSVLVEKPLRWVSPSRISGDSRPPRGHLLLWSDWYRAFPLVEITQNGRVIRRRRLLWPSAPGRMFRVPFSILDRVEGQKGDVCIRIR